MKLSVIPTTYELPSAPLATLSATSLPSPPHVVSVSKVWLWTLPIASATDKVIKKKVFMVLRYRFCAFVSLSDVGRENEPAKGYQVVTLAEYVSVGVGDCIPAKKVTNR